MSTTTDIYGTRTIYYTLDSLTPNEYEESSLSIQLDIYETTKTLPVVGVENNLDGIKWDISILPSLFLDKSRHNNYLNVLDCSEKEGSKLSDFKSGKVTNLEVININNYYPVVSTGTFSAFHELKNLYSDYSISETIDPSNLNEDNYVYCDLNQDFIEDTITIKKYKLLEDKFYQSVISYRKVDDFDSINDYQFKIENNRVILNTSPRAKHGKNVYPVNFNNVRNYCVKAGNGNGTAKDFFLSYAPISSEMIVAYVLYANGTIERWYIVDNLDSSLRTDTHLTVNSDLGVISCGGTIWDNLVLLNTISESDTELTFYTIQDIENYPQNGILNINNEQIKFTGRTYNTFLNCERGYNSTVAATHEAYSVIEIEPNGFAISEFAELYLSYQSTAKLEYEITDTDYRTTNISVKPSENIESSQILEIIPKVIDLDRLILSAEEDVIFGNKYGPISFGTDTVRCEVQALNSFDNSVPNIKVTLEILNDEIGLINGDATSAIQITDNNGKCYYYYNAPVDISDYAQKYSKISVSGGSTTFNFSNLDTATEIEEISLFQILKHDPCFGTNGIKTNISSYSEDTTFSDSAGYIVVDQYIEDIYKNGTVYIVDNSNYIYTRRVTHIVGNKIYLSLSVNSSLLNYCYILSENDLVWDAARLNGVYVVLYNWNSQAEHPVTGVSGAYSPITPDSISGTEITYNLSLPEPEPLNIDSNLGGYMLVAPITVYLRAKATDPYSGNIIYSNTISFKVVLPDYLTGVDNTNLPIPKGFNFIVDENNIGNGLGGSNFISINKQGGLYGLQLRFSS